MRTRAECLAEMTEMQRQANECRDPDKRDLYWRMAMGWKYVALLAGLDGVGASCSSPESA